MILPQTLSTKAKPPVIFLKLELQHGKMTEQTLQYVSTDILYAYI